MDSIVGALRTAAEKAAPGRATVCVVSDHGFAAIKHDVNLYAAFREAGLFSVDNDNKITDWKAMLWPAGGSAAVMLADPKDEQLRARVKTVLDKLASDPANGIDRIWSQQEMQRARGFPNAVFLVSLKIGYEVAYSLSMPLITKPSNLGMHGYVPERNEMRSSFFIVGPHIPAGRSLGEIDMRQIAPTLASVLHIHLAGAELKSAIIRRRRKLIHIAPPDFKRVHRPAVRRALAPVFDLMGGELRIELIRDLHSRVSEAVIVEVWPALRPMPFGRLATGADTRSGQ